MKYYIGQKVKFNGLNTEIDFIHNDGTCNIVNPDWNWDLEAECVNEGIEYDTPYIITVNLSDLKILS